MAVSDEDQMRSMLGSMGVESTDAAFPQQSETSATSGPSASPVEAMPAAKPENTGTVDVAALLEKRAGGSREMSLSTLVHLLGLSTASQVNLIDSKFDVVNSKLTTMLAKIDRISADLAALKSDSAMDRIDFALTEMRALLKRIAPSATGSAESEAKADSGKASTRAKILTSEAPKQAPKAVEVPPAAEAAPAAETAPAAKAETKIIEQDNLEEFQGQDDASFQTAEAKRIREQQSK